MSEKDKSMPALDVWGSLILSLVVASVILILVHLYLFTQHFQAKILGYAGLALLVVATIALKYRQSRARGILAEKEHERQLREQMEQAWQAANKELHQTKKDLEHLIDSSSDSIIATDGSGNVVLFNTGAEALLGYRREEVIGSHVTNLYNSVEYAKGVMRQMRQSGGKVTGLETLLKTKAGELIPVLISASILYDEEGNETGTAGFSKDLRDRKEMELMLEELATTDPLTKLYNRSYFASKLKEEFQRAVRYEVPLSLLILDIDHFKSVNDTFGHAGGDAYLKALAHLIAGEVRTADTVARYGGEEMVVIMPHTQGHDALVVAERLRRSVASLEVTFEGQPIFRTISIGVTSFPDAVAVGPEELLRIADSALYEAKRGGRNQTVLKRIHEEIEESYLS